MSVRRSLALIPLLFIGEPTTIITCWTPEPVEYSVPPAVAIIEHQYQKMWRVVLEVKFEKGSVYRVCEWTTKRVEP